MKLTQRKRLRELFEARPLQWISVVEIFKMGILQYNARLHEIKREGMDIINRVKIVNGQHHSCYLYRPEPKVQKEMEFVK